ncbi:hypothetical protein MXB_4059 [Myxobolus squamalis]|nr:hypothetical protein MXB_4059 [Myxobolus squamalis]
MTDVSYAVNDCSKKLLESFDIDLIKIVEDEEELQNFLNTIPKLVVNEHDAVVESNIKIFYSDTTPRTKKIKHRFLSIFGVEMEVIDPDDIKTIPGLLQHYSKSKLNNRELKFAHFKDSYPDTNSFFIANTFYFSAHFKFPFDSKFTKLKKFHINSNLSIEVETMSIKQSLRTCIHPELDVSLIEIPFENSNLSALIFHPITKDSSLASIIKKINALMIEDCMALLEFSQVALHFPKLKFHSHLSISDQLNDSKLFDLPKNDGENYNLTEFTQAVCFGLNESGISSKFSSRAAPISVEEMQVGPISVHKINRPFLLIIYDAYYRCPLFASAIYNPVQR